MASRKIAVTFKNAAILNLIASTISAFCTGLINKSVDWREKWVKSLSDDIVNLLVTHDTNVGIIVKFNAKTLAHTVSVQTY